jgi:hypothetical protein
MKKYNKKQRNEIYKKAYISIKERHISFVCFAVSAACEAPLGEHIEITDVMFPELFSFKDYERPCWLSGNPYSTEDGKSFGSDGMQYFTIREIVLEFCIAMTE